VLEVGRVHPGCLLEQPERAEHARKHSRFGSGLSGAVDSDLDGLVVRGCENLESI
jgi:hypothetical protein